MKRKTKKKKLLKIFSIFSRCCGKIFSFDDRSARGGGQWGVADMLVVTLAGFLQDKLMDLVMKQIIN